MLALVGAIVIGVSLGLFGSGGSILTVPVLLYLLHMPAQLAIASSLLIVAGISLFGSVRNGLCYSPMRIRSLSSVSRSVSGDTAPRRFDSRSVDTERTSSHLT